LTRSIGRKTIDRILRVMNEETGWTMNLWRCDKTHDSRKTANAYCRQGGRSPEPRRPGGYTGAWISTC
jgi:hypothetical protein